MVVKFTIHEESIRILYFRYQVIWGELVIVPLVCVVLSTPDMEVPRVYSPPSRSCAKLLYCRRTARFSSGFWSGSKAKSAISWLISSGMVKSVAKISLYLFAMDRSKMDALFRVVCFTQYFSLSRITGVTDAFDSQLQSSTRSRQATRPNVGDFPSHRVQQDFQSQMSRNLQCDWPIFSLLFSRP